MTTRELISILERMPANMEVGYSYDYGDYHGSRVVVVVTDVDTFGVVHSDYHNALRRDDDGQKMVILEHHE